MLKKHLFFLILLISFFCNCFNSFCQSKQVKDCIKGNVILDSTWNNKIYLSLIPSFNKMHTISNSMIISASDIDKNGYFEFDTSFLPKEEHLYRVHISKKNAPPASLIIGGKDENHLFLIFKQNSCVFIKTKRLNFLFKDSDISGNQTNLDLEKINKISQYLDSTGLEETYLKREFISKGINEKLRFIADSSSNMLVSLYALHKSNYESNYAINKQFYYDYVKKWTANTSNYITEFKNGLPIQNKQSFSYSTLTSGLICFFIGIALSYYFFVFKKSSKIKRLSLQERKIFLLLKSGKTNKEISQELNIGVSTVKSHASKIYNKLDVNSKKELIDLNL